MSSNFVSLGAIEFEVPDMTLLEEKEKSLSKKQQKQLRDREADLGHDLGYDPKNKVNIKAFFQSRWKSKNEEYIRAQTLELPVTLTFLRVQKNHYQNPKFKRPSHLYLFTDDNGSIVSLLNGASNFEEAIDTFISPGDKIVLDRELRDDPKGYWFFDRA